MKKEKDKKFFAILFVMVSLTFLFSLISLGQCILEIRRLGFMECPQLHDLLIYRIFIMGLLLAASIFLFNYARAYIGIQDKDN